MVKKVSLIMFIGLLFMSSFLGSKAALGNSNSTQIKNDEKIIYLTFDDGPSVMTDKVLDVLKENDVKATFFIIGNKIKGQEAVVKRIYTEGHSIGLHTYTHTYKNIL